MPIQTIDKDILPQIDAGEAVEATQSLRDRVGSIRGCETLVDVRGAELQVCYNVGVNGVSVSAELDTPYGGITLGSVGLTRDGNCATLNGGRWGFKAEVSACFDFSNLGLRIEYQVCPPGGGGRFDFLCQDGSITISL